MTYNSDPNTEHQKKQRTPTQGPSSPPLILLPIPSQHAKYDAHNTPIEQNKRCSSDQEVETSGGDVAFEAEGKHDCDHDRNDGGAS